MTSAPLSSRRPLPHWELIALLAACMALNAAAIDIVIPAMSNIGSALDIQDENSRQFVITAYILGAGGAQIFYGSLADRFGRRPVLLAGLSIYTAASIAAMFAPTFGALLALRAVQGIGAASTRVIATAIVRDLFDGRRMASVMSIIMMIFMVVPILAPNIGTLVLLFGNWREIFLLMVTMGIVALVWSAMRLPETLRPEDRRPLTVSSVAGAFRAVLGNRMALGYVMGTALFFGVLFAFINQAEQIYTGVYGLGPEFTLYFSAVAILMSGVAFVNSRLVERIGTRKLSHGALVAFFAFSAVHLGVALFFGGAAPFPVFLGLFSCAFCMFGLIGTNMNALAMEPLGHVAGTASAILGFTQMVLGGLIGAAIAFLYDGTMIPILVGYVVLPLLALGCAWWAEGGALFRSRNAPVAQRQEAAAE